MLGVMHLKKYLNQRLYGCLQYLCIFSFAHSIFSLVQLSVFNYFWFFKLKALDSISLQQSPLLCTTLLFSTNFGLHIQQLGLVLSALKTTRNTQCNHVITITILGQLDSCEEYSLSISSFYS